MPKPIQVPSGLRWRALDEGEQRQAIRSGWEAFQFKGWQAEPPFPLDDPRRWLWQNGMEGAERYRREPAFTIQEVQGWR